MWVALDQGEIVGEVGSIPVRFQCGKETFPAAQTCDVTILPDYQKEGAFFRLYGESAKEHIGRGILFVYGFSIPKTLQISTTLLGYHPVCPVRRWVLILNPGPYIAKRFRSPLLGRLAGPLGRRLVRRRLRRMHRRGGDGIVTEVLRFDERFDRFWEERRNDHEIMVVRDSEYLNWRYADHPMGRYRILASFSGDRVRGFIVLTTAVDEVRRGFIMDLMVDPAEKEVFDPLLAAALDFFQREKIDHVSLWLPERDLFGKEFERWGFVRKDSPHHLIARWTERPAPAVDPDYLTTSENWHFTLGDSDYH